MGLFDNLFGKKPCVLCGAEVGAMHRDKIKNKEYVCNECARKCSQFVRLSEMDKETVQEHISFMEKREKIYEQYLAQKGSYPSALHHFGIVVNDEIGMLAIRDKPNSKKKVYHEVIRYDEIESYESYKETTTTDGKEVFKESGVKLKLVSSRSSTTSTANEQRGLRVHPYVTHEIKLCFNKNEKDAGDGLGIIQHLDQIFGVRDNEHGFLGLGMSKAEKRDLQAKTDMAKLMGGVLKSAVKGESGEGLQEQFAQAQQSADDAMTGGLAVYSRRADEAENSVAG